MRSGADRGSARRRNRRSLGISMVVVGSVCVLVQATSASSVPQPATRAAKAVPGTSCPSFPPDSWWNTSVASLPVHAKSSAWMSNMRPDSDLHPDFGPAFDEEPVDYGIPVTVVDSTHLKVAVEFDFAEESDHVGYPLGDDTLIEGGSDRHTVVVDKDSCRLWETWATERTGSMWSAGSGATWDLRSNALRPDGLTSADAAGLPILPGLLRYDEVASGSIGHAIRFTTRVTDRSYMWPARHQAGAVNDANYPPMGARFRLRASFPISQFSPEGQAVLTAMKTYGMVLADNGGPWFFQGERDQRWANELDLLEELKSIPASAFEAVDTSSLMTDPNSMAARQFTTPTPTVDRTAPRTRLRIKPATPRKRVVRMVATANEAGAVFQCKLDARKQFRSCKPSQKLRVRPGRHTLRVRAIDPAGNVDRSPARASWTTK